MNEDARAFADALNVTTIPVHLAQCTYRNYSNARYNEKQVCAAPYPDFKLSWGRYALIHGWLAACHSCDGPVLLTDFRDVFFQRSPFDGLTIDGLQVFEEHPRLRTTNWLVDWPVQACTGLRLDKPMLCSGTTVGTRKAMLKYLRRMVHAFKAWGSKPSCRFATVGDDQSIHNYLYYTGELPFAHAVPHRTGIVNTVGYEGAQIYRRHVAEHGGHNNASGLPYDGATSPRWIGMNSGLIDRQGFLTDIDNATRSRVVHQYDRLGPPFLKWLRGFTGEKGSRVKREKLREEPVGDKGELRHAHGKHDDAPGPTDPVPLVKREKLQRLGRLRPQPQQQS